MSARRQQRVGVRWQVDPDDLGLLVHDDVEEAGILMAESVVILAPYVRGEQVVQRGDRPPPGNALTGSQPLRVLVEHRVDDVDERLVAGEDPVPPGEQVGLQPPLAQVLAEHLHDPAVRGQVFVGRQGLRLPGPAGDLEHGAKPVGRDLIRAHYPEVVGVVADHIAQVGAEDPGGLTGARSGLLDVHRVVAEVGKDEGAPQQAPVGVRIRAHPPVALRLEEQQFRMGAAHLVEQFLGLVVAHPGLEGGAVVRVRAHIAERHLMRSPRAFDGFAVHRLGAGPALGRPQDDHRPAWHSAGPVQASLPLDQVDAVKRGVERLGHLLMDDRRIVALDEVGLVAVPLEQLAEILVWDARQYGGISDLVAVQVQDGQHGAVMDGVEELVRVPAGRQRPGLGLAIADDTRDDQAGIVERGAVGVHEGVTELTALVDRSRRFRRHVARDSAGEGELAEQPAHAVGVA